MSKKLLIDLIKIRDLEDPHIDAVYFSDGPADTYRTVRELATFLYTCRKCELAPCIAACPAEALEKDNSDMVIRSLNLCVRCKSCIVSCPFGTMPDNLFSVKTSGYRYFNIANEDELKEFAGMFPDEAVCITDEDENSERHIHKLNDKVLIKELTWS